jgi:hypothetical protein
MKLDVSTTPHTSAGPAGTSIQPTYHENKERENEQNLSESEDIYIKVRNKKGNPVAVAP